MSKPERTWPLVTAIALAGAALCLPIFGGDWFAGHEQGWYVARTDEYLRVWRSGVPWPRWCPDMYGGYGAPFFNFYAPLYYAVGALFRLFGAGVLNGPKLAVVFFGALGGVGVFGLVRAETRRLDAALVAAAMFLANPYRLCNLYIRGDLAEFSAMALLPFPFWFYRELARAESSRWTRFGFVAALSHAALLMTHTITGLWATELFAIVLAATVIPILQKREWRRFAAISISFIGALMIAAIYLIPALVEKRYVHIDQLIASKSFQPEFHPAEWALLFEWRGYFTRLPPATPVGWLSLGLPIAVAAALTIGFVFWRRGKIWAAAPWWAGALVMTFAVSDWGSGLWRARVLPFGTFIQFPWRLLAQVALWSALAFGVSWARAVEKPRRLLAAALAVLFFASAWPLARATAFIDRSRLVLTAGELVRIVHGTTGVDEYLPAAAVRPPRARDAIVTADAPTTNAIAVGRGAGFEITADAAGPDWITVAQFWFPGWTLDAIEGPATPTLAIGAKGELRVMLPAAGHYRFVVRFGATATRAAATTVTWLALFALWPALALVRGRRRENG